MDEADMHKDERLSDWWMRIKSDMEEEMKKRRGTKSCVSFKSGFFSPLFFFRRGGGNIRA